MYSSLKRAILNYDGLEKIQEMNYKIISEKANYKNRMPVLFKALEDLVID